MLRRKFLKQALAAALCLPTGRVAQASQAYLNEEIRKKNKARYHFIFSSPYPNSAYLTIPHAHQQIKERIETLTQHKVYVTIVARGQRGIGTALANSVSHGISQGALLSFSNLAPKVPEVDILNIPFWAASDLAYLKLVNSSLFHHLIFSRLAQHQQVVLFPYLTGARTVSSLKAFNQVLVKPEDFKDVIFRVPGSPNLMRFYQLAQAKIRNIKWSLTAANARAGRFQALDPSMIGLHAGPDGLKDEIGVISEIESVHDGWVAIGHKPFFDAMESRVRSQFFDACQAIQEEQMVLSLRAKALCRDNFISHGVKIYTPTADEIQTLARAFGHAHPVWAAPKQALLGKDGLRLFDQLYQIANG